MTDSFSRRRFLVGASLALPALHLIAQDASTGAITIQIPAEANGPVMPDNFIGLSYEIQQLTDPSFFSPSNTGLVNEFKTLSPHGILRLGGNTS